MCDMLLKAIENRFGNQTTNLKTADSVMNEGPAGGRSIDMRMRTAVQFTVPLDKPA